MASVTLESKERLFQDALQTRESVAESQLVLDRLHQLDPALGNAFMLKESRVPHTNFKLCYEADMRSDSPPESSRGFESYIIMSYCWHNSDWRPLPGYSRTGDLGGFPVSQIMADAFAQRRISRSEGIWIDQLCIDQGDEDEKLHSISSMDLIYRSAREMVVVLEDVEMFQHEHDMVEQMKMDFMDFIGLSDTENRSEVPQSIQLPDVAPFLMRILAATWFTRAWCSHEFHLGKNTVFLIPYREIHYELDAQWLRIITGSFLELTHSDSVSAGINEFGFEIARQLRTAISRLFIISHDRNNNFTKGQKSISYFRMFRDVERLHCSVITDKITIATNVSGLGLYFKGNIETAAQCRWTLVLLALAGGDSSLLCGPALALLAGGLDELKGRSWRGATGHMFAPMLPPHSYIDRVSTAGITINLVLLRFGWRPPTTSSLKKAATFLQHCLVIHLKTLLKIGPDWYRMYPEFDLANVRQKKFVEMLACSLDCGTAWMANVANSQSFNIPIYMENFARSETCPLWRAVTTFLIPELLSQGAIKEGIQYSLLSYITFLLTHEHGLLEDADEDIILTKTGHALGQLGITTKPSSPGLYMAIPQALIGSPYDSLRRVWIIEKVDETAWRLRGTTFLFGCPELEVSGDYTRLLEKQLVRRPKRDEGIYETARYV